MLPWIISHLNNISCREKQTNKQTNKQKRRQWPEMPFCSAIATNGALGFVAQTDLILALGLHLCKNKSIVADIP